MDIAKTFDFIKEDKDWVVKLLIVGLISLIPVVGQLYAWGWMMEISKRTELGKGGTLPDVDFGTFLKYGFRYTVLEIIYSILPSIVLFAMMFIGSILLGVDNGFLNFIGSIFMLVLFIIMIVVIVALYALSFAGYLRIMDTGTISAGLDFDLILNMVRNNPREFLIVIGMSIVYCMLACLGLIVCCVGILFTMPLASAGLATLLGQLSLTVKNRPASGTSAGSFFNRPAQSAKPDTVVPPTPVTIPVEIDHEPMRGTTGDIIEKAGEAISEGKDAAASEIVDTAAPKADSDGSEEKPQE